MKSRITFLLLDHPFALAVGMYLATVLGCCFINEQPANVSYLAARELVYNHRVARSDLALPLGLPGSLGFYLPSISSLEGKYVRYVAGIAAGRPIDATVLASTPSVKIDGTYRAVEFPLPANSQTAEGIDVRSVVELSGKPPGSDRPIDIQATVLAILCLPKKMADENDNCSLLLKVPQAQSQVLLQSRASFQLSIR